MERSADWLDQARGEFQHARSDVELAFYDWACFSAQQAAGKAVKALSQKMGALGGGLAGGAGAETRCLRRLAGCGARAR